MYAKKKGVKIQRRIVHTLSFFTGFRQIISFGVKSG